MRTTNQSPMRPKAGRSADAHIRPANGLAEGRADVGIHAPASELARGRNEFRAPAAADISLSRDTKSCNRQESGMPSPHDEIGALVCPVELVLVTGKMACWIDCGKSASPLGEAETCSNSI